MFYSPLVKKACDIAIEAHGGDADKGGWPYVLHPLFLAFQMEDEVSACVALLHDVVEDHGDKYGFEWLEAQGFPGEVLRPLRLLTHEKGANYGEYIRRISADPVAARVKLADLRHNTDLRRTDGVPPKKYCQYIDAIRFLQAARGGNDGPDAGGYPQYMTTEEG